MTFPGNDWLKRCDLNNGQITDNSEAAQVELGQYQEHLGVSLIRLFLGDDFKVLLDNQKSFCTVERHFHRPPNKQLKTKCIKK